MSVGIWRRAVVSGGLAALLLVAPADAQEAGPPTVEVDVSVGVDGYADPDASLPVTVVFTAPELLVGRISVGSGGLTMDVDIEVPAESPKRYEVSAAPPGRTRSVSVAVWKTKPDGSEERIVTRTARVEVPREEVLVGLFGVEGVETNLRSAVTRPIAREVVPLRMTAEMFEWESSVLSYVLVGSGSLGELTADQLSSVDRWVRAGGRMYGPRDTVSTIADPAGGRAWPGTSAVVTRLGDGEVGALEPSEVTVDEWSALLRATPPLGLIRNEGFNQQPFGLVTAASAGREATVPALPWLLAGIALFVVLVGPVNFFVLRRFGRPELAWITVPVLSAVFVAGFWVVGRSQLQDFTVSSASVVIDADARVDGFGGFVLQVESGGPHDVVVADGWQVRPATLSGAETGKPLTAADGRAGLSFDLDDLGVGTGLADWQPDEPTDVEVVLAGGGNETRATVTNSSPHDFWSWGLIVNGVGYLGAEALPASAAEQALDVRITSSRPVYEPVIAEAVNRRGFQFDEFDSLQYGVVNALAAYAEERLPALRRSGVFFFGLVEQSVLPLEVDGRNVTASGPGLVVKKIELLDGGALALGLVQPELLEVTGAATVEAFYEEIYAYGADEVFFAYAIPPDAPPFGEISPGTQSLAIAEAFRWETGEFEPIEWGASFDTRPYVSPGGDLVVRAAPRQEDQFFDTEIRLARYALKWSVS